MQIRLAFVILFLACSVTVRGQYMLRMIDSETGDEFAIDSNLPTDSLGQMAKVTSILEEWRTKGYLLASLDNVMKLADTLSVQVYRGKQFEYLNFTSTNVPPQILKKVGFTNRKLSFTEWGKVRKLMLDYSENHGYPFAELELDSLKETQEGVFAALNYRAGSEVVFDTLIVKSNERLKVQKKFFHTYLGIKEGDLFSQKGVKEVEKRIKALPYLVLERIPEVRFENNKANVELFLKRRKANTIDGIVGFLPNAQEEGKLLLTGQLKLDLYNPLGTGKHVFFEWQRLKEASQTLNILYEHPNLLKTPLDLEAKFFLQKEDSSYINLNRKLGLKYRFPSGGMSGFFTEWKDSRSIEEEGSEGQKYPDSNVLLYGVSYQQIDLDDFFFPRKGYTIDFSIAGGDKAVTLQTESMTDSISNLTQIEINTDFKQYIKTGKNSTLFLRENIGWMYSDTLFLNDLYRVGGFKSLRGFNEAEFFVSAYGICTVEWRLFFEQQSYLFLFTDGGWINSGVDGDTKIPIGIGSGLSFATKAGVFNLAYAIGKVAGQPFSAKLAKVHFGLVSRF
ncbi:hypothetical protein V6R21_32005 [Limibacter armeniacum]|uniref:hypothetical protein n=1 Tax=Limibacter armeniacum TaxID=466084 RepID=UPI002FE54819